jgi:hypothetical protein
VYPASAARHCAPAINLSWQGSAQLHAALESLLGLEKSSRLAEDITATKACCSAVLEACFHARDWKSLEEHVTLLAKRRGQLKQAIQAFVRQAMTYVDATPDTSTRVSLINTLLAVTEGKVRGGALCFPCAIQLSLDYMYPGCLISLPCSDRIQLSRI